MLVGSFIAQRRVPVSTSLSYELVCGEDVIPKTIQTKPRFIFNIYMINCIEPLMYALEREHFIHSKSCYNIDRDNQTASFLVH